MPPAKARRTTAEPRLAADPGTNSHPADASVEGVPGDFQVTDAAAADQTTQQEHGGHSDEEPHPEEVERA